MVWVNDTARAAAPRPRLRCGWRPPVELKSEKETLVWKRRQSSLRNIRSGVPNYSRAAATKNAEPNHM